jgi:hypothetical protein
MVRFLPLALALAIAPILIPIALPTLALAQTLTLAKPTNKLALRKDIVLEEEPILEDPTVPEGYRTVEGESWSFAVPRDWQETEFPNSTQGSVSIVAQLSDRQEQLFINLVAEPYEGDIQNYIQLSLENMATMGFTVHDQHPVEVELVNVDVGALSGVELESSLPSMPVIRALQRVTVASGNGFALTCGSLETNFEVMRSTCSTILETLRVMP